MHNYELCTVNYELWGGGRDTQDDNLLMERVKNGDRQAFEALVLAHREAAVSFAAGILSDYHLAEDVVQESFARVYLRRMDYASSHTFKTYLYTIIRRRCIDDLRRAKRDPADLVAEYPPLPASESDPAAAYLRKEERQHLRQELALLPAPWRAALYLYAVEGMPYKDIAAIQGVSVAKVKIDLHRARQTIRRTVGQATQPERSNPHEK
jgi:RNA polymerase sigma-70 factor (ECF subfamily)